MLKGINPLLTPDLLWAIHAMGHGDTIAIVDGNYPATADAVNRPVIMAPSSDVIEVVTAVLQVMPLDGADSVQFLAKRTGLSATEATPRAQKLAEVLSSSGDMNLDADVLEGSLSKSSFREQVRSAFVVVATIDPLHWGCFTLKKGVLPEPEMD